VTVQRLRPWTTFLLVIGQLLPRPICLAQQSSQLSEFQHLHDLSTYFPRATDLKMEPKESGKRRISRVLEGSLVKATQSLTRRRSRGIKASDHGEKKNTSVEAATSSQPASTSLKGLSVRQGWLQGGTPKMLCEKCQYIFNHLDELTTKHSENKFRFYNNTSFMKQAAIDGCLLCGQILHALELYDHYEDADIRNGHLSFFRHRDVEGKPDWSIYLEISSGGCVHINILSHRKGTFNLYNQPEPYQSYH